MGFSSENLLKQLNSRRPVDWITDLIYHEEAYAFLTKMLKEHRLNFNQTFNALHILFQSEFHDHWNDSIPLFIEYATSSNLRIRSEAIRLVVGLVYFSRRWQKTPLTLSSEQKKILREAIASGLTSKAIRFVNSPEYQTVLNDDFFSHQ